MGDERGLTNGVQVTLLLPLAFLVLLLTLQWAMVSWAQATALAAAQDGARVAAVLGGSSGDGRSVALAAADNGSISGLRVEVQRGPVQTVATIKGQAVSLVPGWAPSISKSATVPSERLTRS